MRSLADCAPPPSPPPLNTPPSEPKNGKRVRKLKKRKTAKKSQGREPPESSDTELDGEALRPKWLRPRRRPSGGSQVSTSTQPSEERDAEVSMDLDLGQGEEAFMLHLDSEDSMEVMAACQHPHMDALVPSPPAQLPDPSRPEAPSLACNEVTSTSDMDICRSSERWGVTQSLKPQTSHSLTFSEDLGKAEIWQI